MDNSTISFITNPPFGGFLTVLKFIFIGLSLILVIFIILLLRRTNWLKFRLIQDLIEITTYKPLGAKKSLKQWLKIKERLETSLESEFKLAIIEADSMVDDVLKKMGYKGESLGERLKQVNVDIMPNVEQIREAHQTRNDIVHDPDYRLDLDEAKRVISLYEATLTELGMI